MEQKPNQGHLIAALYSMTSGLCHGGSLLQRSLYVHMVVGLWSLICGMYPVFWWDISIGSLTLVLLLWSIPPSIGAFPNIPGHVPGATGCS
eukprot:1152582-Pelagomonas_calceolata.AAC.6